MKIWKFAILFVFTALIGCAGAMTTNTRPPSTRPLAPTTAPSESPKPTPSLTSEARPSPESGTAVTDPTLAQLIAQAKADLAQRVSAQSDSITVKSTQAMEWPDTSLGCPKPGMMYAQVITPGYLIVLQVGGKDYNYHTSMTQAVLCES